MAERSGFDALLNRDTPGNHGTLLDGSGSPVAPAPDLAASPAQGAAEPASSAAQIYVGGRQVANRDNVNVVLKPDGTARTGHGGGNDGGGGSGSGSPSGVQHATGSGSHAAAADISGSGNHPVVTHQNANGSLDITIPKGPGHPDPVRIHVDAGHHVRIGLGTTHRGDLDVHIGRAPTGSSSPGSGTGAGPATDSGNGGTPATACSGNGGTPATGSRNGGTPATGSGTGGTPGTGTAGQPTSGLGTVSMPTAPMTPAAAAPTAATPGNYGGTASLPPASGATHLASASPPAGSGTGTAVPNQPIVPGTPGNPSPSQPAAPPPSGSGGGPAVPPPSPPPPSSVPPPGDGSGDASGPGSRSGGSVAVTPFAIKTLARQIAAVESLLQQAGTTLQGASISNDAFSSDGLALANVYPGALNFGVNDINSKRTHLQQMSGGLLATAATWEQAEQKSTVQVVTP